MKYKQLLTTTILSATLCCLAPIATAKKMYCPSVDSLKEFSGYVIEYPLIMDVQKQEPYSWLVAQYTLSANKETVNLLTVSPVVPQDNESPLDASEKMLEQLQPYPGSPFGDDETYHCVYWIPFNGSMALLTHAKIDGDNPVNALNHFKYLQKIINRTH